MRRRLAIGALCFLTAVSATIAFERDASACGGCFGPPPPPTESPTVVTDHRMILSISKEKSTLYDQIRYQGSPASFAWVLPINGTVDIGLSSDNVFGGLDALTATVIQAPPQNCPPRPSSCNSGFAASARGSDSSAEDPGGVTVLKKEIVGPYETVQLKAEDPQALQAWLDKNGFVVPADVKPVIDTYVNERFNFLALKLVPGKGVQEMRPVRVTSQGAGVALPLRMVAAGTGPVVGISLWVIAEGRYEPQNFASFFIKTDELIWDWNQNKSNYVDLRTARTAAANGRAWEVESSVPISRQNIESYLGGSRGRQFDNDDFGPGGSAEEIAARSYLAVKDEQGNVTKTAVQARTEDIDTLFYGMNPASTRVTRIRADLAHASLDTDLLMTASQEQSELPRFRQITRELNQPICPVWDGCTQNGTAPRDKAYEESSTDDGCNVSGKRGGTTWLLVALGFAGLTLADARRRRARRS